MHYALAQDFARSGAFDRLTTGDSVQVGDFVLRTVDGIGHVEIVMGVNGSQVTAVYGAHADGAHDSLLNMQTYNSALSSGAYSSGAYSGTTAAGENYNVCFLRPRSAE